ncbi:AlbA family DNA-binding domain-containing protein [Clostridium botulinum]|uniref:AlbA family DNA-binding domain-containing protein n=1 Tax=Clostridium botulinum TaxID=1491 RepID=UPI003DA1E477
MCIKQIKDLIGLKQEGAYWDFKREWYSQEKKADLLHDIICMANNLENKDAYIIIGIDEENNYKVKSVADDGNRKNTQMLVDFLRNKKFAGGIRPTVFVKTVVLVEGEVDVIVIKNNYNTPFYLTEKYQGVFANNIYARVMDTNTPKEKSADIHNVEYLWKKRFRLISTPLERIKYYLEKPDEWLDSPTDWETSKKYYKYSPEFTIEYTLEDDGDAYQYYLFNQTDIRPHWRKIRIFYHQTLLETLEGICLDGGRYFTPTPLTDGVSLREFHNWDIEFKYFIKHTLPYVVHQFYYEPDGDDETISHNKFEECILVFESENEKDAFKKYVLKNWANKERFSENIWLPHFSQIEGYRMEEFKKQYWNVQVLKRMLDEFKIKYI